MRLLELVKLRRAALQYAEHGWPVVRGAYLVGRRVGRHAHERRFDCGEPGCRTVACHPVPPDWERTASRKPAEVTTWWQSKPYSVLLATGHAFDVLEVPAVLGRAAVLGDGFVAARGPVAVAPGGRYMFLVRPGHALLPELAGHRDVVLHGPGSWVPAPPSAQFGGRVRWELPPEQHDWRPAQPYAVQALMLDTLGDLATAVAQHRTWRTTTVPA